MRSIATLAIVVLIVFCLPLGRLIAEEKKSGNVIEGTPVALPGVGATWNPSIASEIWVFTKPILQFTVVILVLVFAIKKTGINLARDTTWKDINMQAFIAIAVTMSFCIASLAGITTAEGLKDITLAVVGFYFGSKANEKLVTTNTPSSTSVTTPSSTITPAPVSTPTPTATHGSSEETTGAD